MNSLDAEGACATLSDRASTSIGRVSLDVIVDLRPESDTYLEHITVELEAESMRCSWLPDAAGRQCRQLRAGAFYMPSAEGGLAYDDPRLGLEGNALVSI